MNRKLVFSLMMVVLTVAIASVPASADSITFNFTDSIEYGHGGETLSFFANIAAPLGNLNPIYLNFDNFNLAAPLFLEDSGFFNNFPQILNPGDHPTALLFTVFIPPGTATGSYAGDFQIYGGADGGAGDLLSDANFLIDVPEPNGLILMIAMSGITLGLLYRYKLLAL
jgi:hypothetical protein